jgi:hypothetical protein
MRRMSIVLPCLPAVYATGVKAYATDSFEVVV